MKDTLVFLGPTLSEKKARAVLDAEYMPPAKQGDILSCTLQYQPRIIVLIDGFFHEALSVWHKEIIHALNKNIHVIGASSMGALRAAELSTFGMIGIGKIFDLYHENITRDDDEVVLVHGPKELNYAPLSIPLINLRFTFEKIKKEKILSEELCHISFALFQELFYPERTYENFQTVAQEKGLPLQDIQKILHAIDSHYVDQKQQDALLALQKAKELTDPPSFDYSFPYSPLFEILYHLERRHYYSENNISRKQIAHYISLHHPQISDLHFAAINQALVSSLSKLLQVTVSLSEIEKEKKRFRTRFQLFSQKQFEDWLAENHLSEDEFDMIAEEKATSRKLYRSINSSQVPWRRANALLKELKWKNEYSDWAKKAAAQEDFINAAAPCFSQSTQEEIYSGSLLEKHARETKWSLDCDLDTWSEDAGFFNINELYYEMLRSHTAKEYLKNFFSNHSL